MERGDLVKIIKKGIEKYNALPKEEKRWMQMQNDAVVSSYMYNLWKRGGYAIYRRIEGNLISGP